MTDQAPAPFEATRDGGVRETLSIQQASTGDDYFEWTLLKSAREVILFAESAQEYDLLQLWVNGHEDKSFRGDYPVCKHIHWPPKTVFVARTHFRIRIKSQPGAKIVASLKYQWLAD